MPVAPIPYSQTIELCVIYATVHMYYHWMAETHILCSNHAKIKKTRQMYALHNTLKKTKIAVTAKNANNNCSKINDRANGTKGKSNNKNVEKTSIQMTWA